MSTTPLPASYQTTTRLLIQQFAASATPHAARPAKQVIRRRATEQQGRSLERLAHAIEYLVDSQLYLHPGAASKDDSEAIQILMRLNREVFAECREIVSIRQGLKLRLLRLFERPESATPHATPKSRIA